MLWLTCCLYGHSINKWWPRYFLWTQSSSKRAKYLENANFPEGNFTNVRFFVRLQEAFDGDHCVGGAIVALEHGPVWTLSYFGDLIKTTDATFVGVAVGICFDFCSRSKTKKFEIYLQLVERLIAWSIRLIASLRCTYSSARCLTICHFFTASFLSTDDNSLYCNWQFSITNGR